MPRRSKSLPKYRLHKASGQAIVTLSGQDHYLGPHGSETSLREYDRLVGEWLANGRRLAISKEAITLVELIAAYWRFAQGYYQKNGKPTGELGAIKAALRRVENVYRDQSAEEFGPLALKAVRDRMIREGVCRYTTNKNVGRIKRMFRWAVSEQLIDPQVAAALQSVTGLRAGRSEAREKPAVQPVEDRVVKATQEHLPPRVADMVRLQRITGMRPNEICQIRPCDLEKSGEVWLYRPASHKTEHHGREHIIPIGPQGQAILVAYLDRAAEAYCFQPCESETQRRDEVHERRITPLSQGNRPGTNKSSKPKRPPGECYTVDSYRRAIQRACDKANVDRWSPNQLRHAFATEVRRQHGLEAAQVLLGHAGADVTQVYAERDLAKGIQVARLLG